MSHFSAGIFPVPRSARSDDSEPFFSPALMAAAEDRLDTAAAPAGPLLKCWVALRLLHQRYGESQDVLAAAAALDMPLIERFCDSPPEGHSEDWSQLPNAPEAGPAHQTVLGTDDPRRPLPLRSGAKVS